MPSITDALRARGIGSGGSGIKQEDLTALIDITNTAEANNDAIKLDVVNKLNAMNPALNLTTASSWSTIRAALASMQYRGAQTITPGPDDITIPAGYHNGSGRVSAVTVPVASVLAGTTIAGQTGTMPNRGAVTITPSAADQTIAAGYHNGAGVVKGVVVPTAKVLNDTTIAQQKGTMPYLTGVRSPAAITIWPDNRDLAVYPEKGYQDGGPGGGEIRITKAHLAQADPNFIAANIVSGKNIFGLVGTASSSWIRTGSQQGSLGAKKNFWLLPGQSSAEEYLEVSYNFPSTPKYIIAYRQDRTTNSGYSMVYTQDGNIQVAMNIYAVGQDGYVNQSGFRIPTYDNSYTYFTWIAVG